MIQRGGKNMIVTLYSTNCPRCVVLEKKLQNARINFSINNNIEEMLALGFLEAPMLEVDGELMGFIEGNKWANQF